MPLKKSSRIKVLYISGWGRSGSTIIGNILGQLAEFSSVGELRSIWQRGFIQNRYCGCGQPFLECATWKSIIQGAYGGTQNVRADEWSKTSFDLTRTSQIFKWIVNRNVRQSREPKLQEYLGLLQKLYESIARVTDSRVLVDASKFPMYGALLGLIPTLDVYTVHLVRDPRATAFSWSRPKQGLGKFSEEAPPVYGTVRSTLKWTTWNSVAEYLRILNPGKYHLLLYEDFVQDPGGTLRMILDFLGEDSHLIPLGKDFMINLHASHTMSGNPNRFQVGNVQIEPDNRWLTQMPAQARFVASALALPLLRHYGYQFWTPLSDYRPRTQHDPKTTLKD